jgi:HAD superfamily hydrolase (TIGR01509 family)
MQINIINKPVPLPEAILLDMDGLLLDTEKVAKHAFFHSCKKINFSCSDKEYAQLTGHGSVLRDKLLTSILPKDANITHFNQTWWEHFQEILNDEVPAKEGALEFLDYVNSRKIKIAVATSSYTQSAETLLTRAKLRSFIGFIVGGDQVRNAKPAPDIYLKAASCVNVSANSCIAFEDSDVGVMAAHAAGIPVIQIPDIKIPSEKCVALGHLIFDSLDKARDELGWR